MLNRRVRALLAKDLRLHGRGILITQVGAIALTWLMVTLRPSDAERELTLMFNVNFLLTGLWGEWLVSREKTKGTFGWLRSLPISDRELVLTKFAGAALCCIALWTLMSAVFASGYFLARPALWMLLCAVLVAFGGITLAARWRFSQKVGQTLPFVLVLALLLIVVAADRRGAAWPAAAAAFWQAPQGLGIAAAILLACYGGTAAVTARWVRMSDTSQLLE